MPDQDDIIDLMSNYDLEENTAERVLEVMENYGLSEDEAIELESEL